MTVDSVGDVDGAENDNENVDEENETKENVNVGSEHIKKVEAYYCELCRIHLAQHEDYETALRRHCQTRTHLKGYLQYKEDKNLRKAAEKIHRKHQENKGSKNENDETSETVEKENKKEENDSERKDEENDAETGDKMWADVDKELGVLLDDEVGHENGNADEDDEEDSRMNSGRYDRFKNSEKITAELDSKDETKSLKEKTENTKEVEETPKETEEIPAK